MTHKSQVSKFSSTSGQAPALEDPQRGFGGHLPLGARPALVVVDFVKAYLLRRSPLFADVEPARQAAAQLVAAARAAGIPVIHTMVRYQVSGQDGGVFFRKVPALRCFLDGQDSELAEFGPGLEPAAGELIIAKQYASAFFATSLASTLTSLQIDTLLIAGVSTSGCIRATAVDACQHGFVPVIVREAVGDRPSAPHEANLYDVQTKYGEVRPLSDILDYLSRTPCERSLT